MAIKSALIGGSGPSLALTDLGRLPASLRIYRTNNFFLEETYVLGRHVDCVYFSGDKRALRFYMATLRKIMRMNLYTIDEFASHHPRAAKLNAAPRRIVPFEIKDPFLKDRFSNLTSRHDRLPTSGVMAALKAVQDGAETLFLAGMDFYEGSEKYVTPVPPRLKKILAPNLAATGYDSTLHANEIDLGLLQALQEQGVKIFATCDALKNPFPLAPQQFHPFVVNQSQKLQSVDDWVAWDGCVPLSGLLAMRAAMRFIERGSRSNSVTKP